jgi:hypothetical protein
MITTNYQGVDIAHIEICCCHISNVMKAPRICASYLMGEKEMVLMENTCSLG